jgi:hypothetical protein
MVVRRIDTPGEASPHVACRKISRSPKSVVNSNCSLRKTRVSRLASSGIRSSGELECANVETLEARNFEVTWLVDVTWDDVDTWDVCHVSVSFEPMED